MGAASSIDASRVQEMSEAEISVARRDVVEHVNRLEAENEALKARIAALEAGPTRHPLRRNVSAEESTSSLPAELQGLDALSASIAAPEALADRSRAAAENPDDEAARRALAESVEEAMRDVREAFASQAGRPGVVTMCDAAIAAGDDDFLSVYKVMWDRIAKKTDDLEAYETAVASVRRRSLTAASVTQGTESIAELVAAAGRVKARFDEQMSSLADTIKGARYRPPAELKKTSRIVEKAFCQGTCSRIFDVVRCMIVVDDMNIAAEALSRLAADSEVEIVRIKERFVREPTSGGWRDCMINGRFTGGSPHVWEVQIVHRELLVARRGLPGHAIYNCVRVATELLEKMGLEKHDRAARIGKLAAASGETAKDFRDKGVEAADLVAAACFEPHELKDAGLSADELSAAGLPLSGILQAGYEASDLRGCSDTDDPGALLHAGYDFDEVAAAFRIDLAKDRDRLVLLHVKHAVGCAELLVSKKKGWGGENLVKWGGVKTNGKGRVVELDLSNLKANGVLPETIRELQFLENISLKGNQDMVGPLPRGLGFLEHLSELDLTGTGLRFPGTGVPASKRVEKVAAFCERLFDVHVADVTFGRSDFQKIRWNKLSVDGRTPNGAGVLRGWIAVAVEGKRVDGSLDKFETALDAAARTIAPTISFYGRAPWCFDGSNDRRSPKFECIDARTAYALEEARAAGLDGVALRLDTKAGKGRTYDFDLVNMTQCYRATAHDKFAYKPRAIKRYEFGTPEWSEYVRANHESSLRNVSD
mmetsp:Transcript_21815/g.66991  ORF Transcript_21815/g.66991 Transcript_21815/m.66991 type:complete len:766 (-) Transcript_21815:11-2308(-)